jgi:ATP-dependent helicase/nuclease subunit B
VARAAPRHDLGLPSLERRIGLAAHDFAGALGGRQVLVTAPAATPARRPSRRASGCGSKR